MNNSMIDVFLAEKDGCLYPELEAIFVSENDRTKAASSALEKALGLDDAHYSPDKQRLLDMVTELESAREELGFKNGFRVAVRLMTEIEGGRDMKHSVIDNILSARDGCTCPELEALCPNENERTKAASDALEKALGLDEKSYKPEKLGLLEQVLDLEAAREALGFQNGFRVAARLMTECLR